MTQATSPLWVNLNTLTHGALALVIAEAEAKYYGDASYPVPKAHHENAARAVRVYLGQLATVPSQTVV